MENGRLWARVVRRHRIVKSETVDIASGDFEAALLEACRRFDVQRPLQLPKHDRELSEFGRTFYSKEHFLEPIDFDRLEVELLPADGEERRAHPRTPLMDA